MVAQTRRALDKYYTPEWLVKEFLTQRLRYGITGRIFEPCCGDGAISNYLKEIIGENGAVHDENMITRVTTNDVDVTVEADTHELAQDLLPKVNKQFDWIITNPPFNQAHEIIPLAYESACEGIVMLLRLSYLEPCQNRADWLDNHPPTSLVVNKRVSFTGNGKSDSCTTAWFVWSKAQRYLSRISFLY